MGILYVQGKLSHPLKLSLQRNLRFLVDPGAFFSVVPREILSVLETSSIREETVQFADGRKAQWKVGEVRLEVDGRAVTTLVLFGKKGTQPLLGAYSLEGLGLSVDSRGRRLVPMPIVIVAKSSRPAGQRIRSIA
ncbi:MAG: hypothetical protein E6J77_04650 [Deltaproteobacteria bacterium]|nr:MAG: hypothetical protein E6J77_04650 [Deltaproteobacteria bacterium]